MAPLGLQLCCERRLSSLWRQLHGTHTHCSLASRSLAYCSTPSTSRAAHGLPRARSGPTGGAAAAACPAASCMTCSAAPRWRAAAATPAARRPLRGGSSCCATWRMPTASASAACACRWVAAALHVPLSTGLPCRWPGCGACTECQPRISPRSPLMRISHLPPVPPSVPQEGRLFPLELEAFPSLEALQAHSAAAHPHCAFCRRTFYDDDALWKHMHQAGGRRRWGWAAGLWGACKHSKLGAAAAQASGGALCPNPAPPSSQAHYSCHVCPPPVAAQAYFNRAPDLQQHMRWARHGRAARGWVARPAGRGTAPALHLSIVHACHRIRHPSGQGGALSV